MPWREFYPVTLSSVEKAPHLSMDDHSYLDWGHPLYSHIHTPRTSSNLLRASIVILPLPWGIQAGVVTSVIIHNGNTATSTRVNYLSVYLFMCTEGARKKQACCCSHSDFLFINLVFFFLLRYFGFTSRQQIFVGSNIKKTA